MLTTRFDVAAAESVRASGRDYTAELSDYSAPSAVSQSLHLAREQHLLGLVPDGHDLYWAPYVSGRDALTLYFVARSEDDVLARVCVPSVILG